MSKDIIFKLSNEFEYKTLLKTLDNQPIAPNISKILNSFSELDSSGIYHISAYYFFHKMLIEKYSEFYYSDSVYPAIITAINNFCIRVVNCWQANEKIKELKLFFIKYPDSIELLTSKIASLVSYDEKSFFLEIIREVSSNEKQIQKAIKFYNNDFEVDF